MDKTVFTSRPDKKTLLQNLATLGMTIVLITVVILRREALARITWMVPAAIILCVYVLDALLFTSVTVYQDRMVAKAGHLSVRRIRFEQIQAVLTSMTTDRPVPIQVLAQGEKRLFVVLKDGSAVCISPQDQQGFIRMMQQLIPTLITDDTAEKPSTSTVPGE